MQVTGKLRYSPVVCAEGKKLLQIQAQYVDRILEQLFRDINVLRGKTLVQARILLTDYIQDPHQNNPKRSLESRKDFIQRVIFVGYLATPSSPAMQVLIKDLYEEDLILTRRSKWWAILDIPAEIVDEARKDLYDSGIKTSPSLWGPHCTVIRGEPFTGGPPEGTEYNILVGDKIRHNKDGYFWLDVKSEELETLRTDLNLPPRPSPPFHITIGKRQ